MRHVLRESDGRRAPPTAARRRPSAHPTTCRNPPNNAPHDTPGRILPPHHHRTTSLLITTASRPPQARTKKGFGTLVEKLFATAAAKKPAAQQPSPSQASPAGRPLWHTQGGGSAGAPTASMGSVDVLGSDTAKARSPTTIAHGPDDRLVRRAVVAAKNANTGPLLHGVLAQHEVQRLSEAFKIADSDCNGEIDQDEFSSLIHRLCAEVSTNLGRGGQAAEATADPTSRNHTGRRPSPPKRHPRRAVHSS